MNPKFIFLLLAQFLLSTAAFALPEFDSQLSQSVFLMRSADGRYCATAFLTRNRELITNLHVVEKVCSGADCSGARLFRASETGRAADRELKLKNGLQLRRLLPGLDLAILEFSEDLSLDDGVFSLKKSPTSHDKFYTLGYPNCGELTLSQGQQESSDTLYLYLSNQTAHGSSGSPVFNADLEIVGVIDQAADLSGAILGRLSGHSFRTRAVRGDLLDAFVSLEYQSSIPQQIELLLNYYKHDLLKLRGIERSISALRYLAKLASIGRQLPQLPLSAEDLRPLMLLGAEPIELLNLQRASDATRLYLVLEQIVLTFNIEQAGWAGSAQNPKKNLADFRRLLNHNNRSEEESRRLLEIVERFNASGYIGVNNQLVTYGAYLAIILIAVLISWSFSL
ncbi:MAG: trypsin-like peptidase domain-containing protein, partial [Bdellovibrionales bacterium]|nr:trypsin-like peptidase domain-containing protein [Bdellovibrionales bacterium]